MTCRTGKSQANSAAGRGYFKAEEILIRDKDGITVYLPRPMASTSAKHGRFSKSDFIYHADDDEYECPAGERLIWRFRSEAKGQVIYKY